MENNIPDLSVGFTPPEGEFSTELPAELQEPQASSQGDRPDYGEADGISLDPNSIDLSKFKKITNEDIANEQFENDRKNTSGKLSEVMDVMNDAIAVEDQRMADLEKPEVQEEIAQIAKENGTYKWAKESRKEAQAKGETGTYQVESVPLSDFAPDYSDFDEDDFTPEEPVKEESAEADEKKTKSSATDGQAELWQQVLALPELSGLQIPSPGIVQTVRDRKPYAVVKSNRAREEGDMAFLNSISKFKKTNYRTVKVPLVNSGFWADMVGTGPQDLILLYQTVSRGIAGIDYEVERMKATIKGVIATTPKVPMEMLRTKIHFADYPLMAFGRVCATFKEISPIATCPECRNEMRFKANPEDLLMNADEMTDRINAMRDVQSYEELSLLAFDRKYEFEGSGISVTVGHPSYIEMVSHLNSLQYYTTENRMSSAEQTNFIRQTNFLSMIRSVTLPNGVRAANIYQKYIALKMLEEEEFSQLVECVEELTEMAIIPRFGIKDVICPHCGKKIDITIASVDDLVFYHSTVYQAERYMKKNSSTNG